MSLLFNCRATRSDELRISLEVNAELSHTFENRETVNALRYVLFKGDPRGALIDWMIPAYEECELDGNETLEFAFETELEGLPKSAEAVECKLEVTALARQTIDLGELPIPEHDDIALTNVPVEWSFCDSINVTTIRSFFDDSVYLRVNISFEVNWPDYIEDPIATVSIFSKEGSLLEEGTSWDGLVSRFAPDSLACRSLSLGPISQDEARGSFLKVKIDIHRLIEREITSGTFKIEN
jgi:hypothetical protein